MMTVEDNDNSGVDNDDSGVDKIGGSNSSTSNRGLRPTHLGPRYMYVFIYIYVSFTLLTSIYKIDYITTR
jgi:hypothetical protein